MNIVVLDGHTLNPGDLSWDALRQLGSCEIFDRSAPSEVVPRAREAEVVLTNKVLLDRATLGRLPKVRYIGVLATGYNVVDVQAARERGIPVTNVPEYGTRSVAQMVFAHVLELTQHVAAHSEAARAGRWTSSPDFCFWDYPLVELEGLSIGIIGYGRIGRAVAEIARAFGMAVLAHEVGTAPAATGVQFVDLDTLFRESDVVSLHCPLTPQTKGLVNAGRLALMKRTAFLINTSRGPLVVEQDLAEALNAGRIAGAGLDVLETEPARADNPLLRARNCHITPHIAWATHSARSRLMRTVVENIAAFRAGRPQNVVN